MGTAPHLNDNRAALLARIAAAPSLFCGLDYDGTLAPLAPTPDDARPLPGTDALLHRLAARRGTRIAIVTGRAIANVQRFLDLDRAYYIGIHGLEIRRPGEPIDYSSAGRAARAILPTLVNRLRAQLGDSAGLLIEEKGAAVALHFRLASAAEGEVAQATLAALVAELETAGEPLELLRGHEVVEVRPRGVDKGRALCELLAANAPDALPLYIGDDQTDEDAFHALPEEAITIRVGAANVETCARHRLADPAEVQAFLEEIVGRG